MLGGGAKNSCVSLTIGRGAVFSYCQALVKFQRGSDVEFWGGEGYTVGMGR